MLKQRPESFGTLSDWLRWHARGLVGGVAQFFARLGLRPGMLTVMGFVLSIVAGVLAAQGTLARAGVVYAIAGAMDTLDGPLARELGRASRFGAFLDSTLDRYAESALLAGLALWAAQAGRMLDLGLIFATLVGSIMVSYTRARAEGLGLDVKIGLMTRFERTVIMLLTLFSGQMTIGLGVLAALANFTAVQRMARVYQLTQAESEPGVAGGVKRDVD